jgi:hypothetical protein
VIAYKFLRAGAEGPFTGFAWPLPADDGEPGAWVSGDCLRGACASGVHACRPSDLPIWLCDELWVAELAGDVVHARSKVVAPRGRLVRRVAEWTPDASAQLSEACARRARRHASAVLRASGLSAAEEELHAFSLDEMADADSPAPRAGARVSAALGYASDAAMVTRAGGPAASVAYIAVRAAMHAADSAAAGARERQWQARWMRDRLSLA